MEYEFLNRFHPRIIDVVERNLQYWKVFHYEIDRKKTQLYFLALVVEGSGVFELNGQATPIKKGSLLHSSPGNHMRVSMFSHEPLKIYSIHFDYQMIRSEGSASQLTGPVGPLPFTHVIDGQNEFFHPFSSVFRLWNEKGPGYEWKVKVAFLKILEELCSMQEIQQEEQQLMSLIMETMDYIQKHYMLPLNRTQLAKKISLSPSYFSVAFRKYTGYTLVRYITKLRLDKAKQLLRSSNLSIANIAQEVGYTDSFYFARVFAKEIGMSPKEYRKALGLK